MNDEEKLKRAQGLVGFAHDGLRAQNDYYPTPSYATEALLEIESFEGSIWECACGDGSMSKVIEAAGYKVFSTDLIDRGYGESSHDFLTSSYTADNVITNPPFTLAEDFVKVALEKTTKKVCLLTKLAFLEGAKRKIMFENTPYKACYVFSKRLTMTRNGVKMKNSGMIPFCWNIWEHGYTGKPTIGWI